MFERLKPDHMYSWFCDNFAVFLCAPSCADRMGPEHVQDNGAPQPRKGECVAYVKQLVEQGIPHDDAVELMRMRFQLGPQEQLQKPEETHQVHVRPKDFAEHLSRQ